MARESVRWVVALVIALGMVLPMAGRVRAEGEKVDRWQWVEDALVWNEQFLESIDQRASTTKTDDDRIALYKTLNKERLDWTKLFEDGLAQPTSRCRNDILVVDVDSALMCEWRDGFMNTILADIGHDLDMHITYMLQYYAFRDTLSKNNADALRGLADVQKSAVNRRLRILRDVVGIARKTRRETFAAVGLPPERS